MIRRFEGPIEYHCPLHGRFELGEIATAVPPAEAQCPEPAEDGDGQERCNYPSSRVRLREPERGIRRRILELPPPMSRFPAAQSEADRCCHTICLDGTTYRCGRDDHGSGIHDAFQRHGDGGLVRW